jgi:hypothetical protein
MSQRLSLRPIPFVQHFLLCYRLFLDGSLSRNLGIAIVNPGISTANVTLTLTRADGVQLATRTITVTGRRQTVGFLTALLPNQTSGGSFGGSGQPLTEYRGTLAITSSVPVSILGIRFRGSNFSAVIPESPSTAPIDLPVFFQGVGGAGAQLVPQFVAGGGWATEIVVSNPGTTSVTFRLDLFQPDGTALTAALNGQRASNFTNVTIPPGGVMVFAPRDLNGDDRF